MKKLFIVIAAISVLAACEEKQPETSKYSIGPGVETTEAEDKAMKEMMTRKTKRVRSIEEIEAERNKNATTK